MIFFFILPIICIILEKPSKILMITYRKLNKNFVDFDCISIKYNKDGETIYRCRLDRCKNNSIGGGDIVEVTTVIKLDFSSPLYPKTIEYLENKIDYYLKSLKNIVTNNNDCVEINYRSQERGRSEFSCSLKYDSNINCTLELYEDWDGFVCNLTADLSYVKFEFKIKESITWGGCSIIVDP